MIVRFACICDLCHQRGEEYGPMVCCNECGRNVNPCCIVNYDPEPGTPTLCLGCTPRSGASTGGGERRGD